MGVAGQGLEYISILCDRIRDFSIQTLLYGHTEQIIISGQPHCRDINFKICAILRFCVRCFSGTI